MSLDGFRALIEEGLRCDLLLLTGGVSMGKYDLVEQVLAELQAEFYFTGAEIQPGRPVVFGSVARAPRPRAGSKIAASANGVPAPHKKYFFGLPGNPVSTMVTFELFVTADDGSAGGDDAAAVDFSCGRG